MVGKAPTVPLYPAGRPPRIQRCLVHAQRVVRRYTTSRPRTTAGKMIYALALKLTAITTTEQATQWVVNLHEFGQIYKHFSMRRHHCRKSVELQQKHGNTPTSKFVRLITACSTPLGKDP